MKRSVWLVASFVGLLLLASCGGGMKEGPAAETPKAREQAMAEIRGRIRAWIGQDLRAGMARTIEPMGQSLGKSLAADPAVIQKARKLAESVLSDRGVQDDLKAIGQKATSGLSKKLKLGMEILKAGGTQKYEEKVRARVERVAMDVVMDHFETRVLADDRMARLLDRAAASIDVGGSLAGLGADQAEASRVSQRIEAEARRLSEGKPGDQAVSEADAWLAACAGETGPILERLARDVAALPEAKRAVRDLTVAVLAHPTTARHAQGLVKTLLGNREIEKALVRVYEAALFEKKDEPLEKRLQAALAIKAVDDAIFKTLERLAAAPGSGPMIERHLAPISSDPALAGLAETAILDLFDQCDAISQRKGT